MGGFFKHNFTDKTPIQETMPTGCSNYIVAKNLFLTDDFKNDLTEFNEIKFFNY